MKEVLIAVAILLAWAGASLAHEVRPAYLEIRQTGPETYDVFWKVPALGDDRRLGLYVRFPEDVREISEPHAGLADGAYSERWSIERERGLAGAEISIEGLDSTVTDVLVRLRHLDGGVQVTRLMPASPSFRVEAQPSSIEVVRTYFVLGVEHILLGVDHLLFVLALLLLVKGWWRIAGTITAFTVAHTITLAAATLGYVHLPSKPVEATIALSIVFVAAEIVHGIRGRVGLTERFPWIVAFTFGLLHGLGFAGALSEIGLPQTAIPLALLCFNVGVEVGQLLFVLGVMLALGATGGLLARLSAGGRTIAGIRCELAAAYAIGGVAAFWVVERTAAFWG